MTSVPMPSGVKISSSRVGQAPVNEVDFPHARVEGVDGGMDFRDHASGNGTVFDEFKSFGPCDGFDEGGRIGGSFMMPGTSEM